MRLVFTARSGPAINVAMIDLGDRLRMLVNEVETVALNGVNLEIAQEEFVAIMGPSGCGKTLILVHKAAFLLRYNPSIRRILLVCYNITLVSYNGKLLIGLATFFQLMPLSLKKCPHLLFISFRAACTSFWQSCF